MANTSLADLRLHELLELIGSDSIAPGAGAAGAVTLALGAACAAKAVSISLKHSPHDESLDAARSAFEKIVGFALQGADADARAFADFIKQKTPSGASKLIETGEAMAHLIHALLEIIANVGSHVNSTMGGDLTAAKALAAAARTIQLANEAEAKYAQRAMAEGPKEA